MAEARPKKRSGGKDGKRGVDSDRRRVRARMAVDCREVKRWTGVQPLRRGSESEETRVGG